jgi:hypothetical protein
LQEASSSQSSQSTAATRCRRVGNRASTVPKSTFPKAVQGDTGSPVSGGGSARGGNPLDSRDRCPQECNLRETKPEGSTEPCPSHSSGRSRPGIRPPADARFACGGRCEEFVSSRERHGRVRTVYRGCSSAGRAPALQAGGHRFESGHLHQHIDNRIGRKIEILVETPTAIFGSSFINVHSSTSEEWL